MYKAVFILFSLLFFMQNLTAAAQAKDKSQPFFYRIEMIDLISGLADYAHAQKPSFGLITNNGLDLYQKSQVPDGCDERLLSRTDGILIEGMQYTWDDEHDSGVTVSDEDKEYLAAVTALPLSRGKKILSVDYCGDDEDKAHEAVKKNNTAGIVSFPARSKDLTSLDYSGTEIMNSGRDITALKDVKSFIILLNPEEFADKEAYLAALKNSDADLLIIDLYYGEEPLSPSEINRLKMRTNGSRRLIFSYMSVGEAESYRYYWQKNWADELPDWLIAQNEQWPGSYRVKYWLPAWQKILMGSENSYLDKILSADFDGVFLDVVDAYRNFEK